MASQTSITAVHITAYSVVFIVRLWIGVAGSASKFCIIRRICMTIRAGIPFTLVFAAVYREILSVVVEIRWRPGVFSVARCTIRRELRSGMVGVGRGIIIRRMTTRASVRRRVVITVVAGSAVVGNAGVRSIQRIKSIVNGECCRLPSWRCGVAHRAVGRQI